MMQVEGTYLDTRGWAGSLEHKASSTFQMIESDCLGHLDTYNLSYHGLMGHVRYINILTWLRGFRVKIVNFLSFFCLSIPKRDLDTKKATPNIKV